MLLDGLFERTNATVNSQREHNCLPPRGPKPVKLDLFVWFLLVDYVFLSINIHSSFTATLSERNSSLHRSRKLQLAS